MSDNPRGCIDMLNKCEQRFDHETQSTDSNQRMDNKAAERSRLYRERHREEINQRRRDIRQHQRSLNQIHTSDLRNTDEIMQATIQLSSISHTQRQQRYYERHKEEINRRKRENRQKQNMLRSIPATAAERNRAYRARKKQEINERRRYSRLRQQLVQQVQTEYNLNNIETIEQITKALVLPKMTKNVKLSTQKQNQQNPIKNTKVSADKEIPNIKVEPLENAEYLEVNKTELDTLNTHKVLFKSRSRKEKQCTVEQSRPKKSQLDLSEYSVDYEEQLCEFGKYVAEQLLCLNLEDAHMAKMDITDALSKFTHKRIREPRTSKIKEESRMVEIEIETVNPVTSKAQVNTTTHSQFSSVRTVSQTSPEYIRSSLSYNSPIGPLKSQSRKTVKSKLTKVALTNVKPRSPPATSIYRSTEAMLSSPVLSTSIGSWSVSMSPQSPLSLVPCGSLVSQTSSTNMDLSEITVKTDPESEWTYSHESMYESEEPESLDVKCEAQSGGET